MIAHKIANTLLEAIDPDNPDSILGAFDPKDTDYTVKAIADNGHWLVYKKCERGEVRIGEIIYDPMTDIPPEADPSWKDLHYWAQWGFRENEQEFYKTYDEAVNAIITHHWSYGWKGESLDIDDPNLNFDRYVQAAYTSPLPGYTIAGNTQDGFKVYKDKSGFRGTRFIGKINQLSTGDAWIAQRNEFEKGMWKHTFRLAFDALVAKDRESYGKYEESQEDLGDLENYISTTEPGVGSLRSGLKQFYDYVGVHVKDAPICVLANQKKWIVTCRRETPMPMPGADAAEWKNQIQTWMEKWADQNKLRILWSGRRYHGKVKFHGFIRKNLTLTFETAPAGAPLLHGWSDHVANIQYESLDDEDDPEKMVDRMARLATWERDLYNRLWEFHPYGIGYQIAGTEYGGIIAADLFFPPEKDGFADRLFYFLREAMPKFFHLWSMNMWTWKKEQDWREEWAIVFLYNKLADSDWYHQQHGQPTRSWALQSSASPAASPSSDASLPGASGQERTASAEEPPPPSGASG